MIMASGRGIQNVMTARRAYSNAYRCQKGDCNYNDQQRERIPVVMSSRTKVVRVGTGLPAVTLHLQLVNAIKHTLKKVRSLFHAVWVHY